jgi:hypothetical protein
MATISNLYIDQGSDFNGVITLTNQDGSPLSLTGYTIKSQFRKSYNSSSFTEFTATVTNASQGIITLRLTAAQSSAVQAGRYLYDIEITSSSGAKTRALEGIVVITPEITKS